MYRILKDSLRRARGDLLNVKHDKKNLGLAAIEIKRRVHNAQIKCDEKKGNGRINLKDKVI
jgi:hypothetical protein